MSQGYSGVQANVLIGAVDADAMGWSADVEVNTWDSTTTADGGWDSTSPSTNKLSGTFDILYNTTKPPFGSLGLTQGTVITALNLYINKTAGNFLTGGALITKVSVKAKIKEGIILTCSFVNRGVWTLPTT